MSETTTAIPFKPKKSVALSGVPAAETATFKPLKSFIDLTLPLSIKSLRTMMAWKPCSGAFFALSDTTRNRTPRLNAL